MIKLDDNLLQEIGLASLPPEEKKKMLAHIYETLEMRVGMELAKQMSDAQLSEFEEFINRNDEAGALRWLETNFPNYKEVVATEFEKLKLEVKQAAPQIVIASQQQAAQATMGGPAPVAPTGPDPYAQQQAAPQQPYVQPPVPSHQPEPQFPQQPQMPPQQAGGQQPLPPIQGQQPQAPLPPIQDNGQPQKNDYDLAG